MPVIVKRLTADGLLEVDIAAGSLREAANYEPRRGVYTVSNSYNCTQVLLLDAHLDRLEDSANREGIPLRYNRRRLRYALRRMIVESAYGDVRFRISIPADAPYEMILSIEPFQPPAPKLRKTGVRCITSSAATRSNPDSKSSEWMYKRQTLEAAMPKGIYETFLVNGQGFILEGLSCNFYAIEDGELLSAGEGVLAGISRKIVIEICAGIIPLRMEAPCVDNIPLFSEAFLTSSSRGIIPVIEIDGYTIGGGTVGPTTTKLQDAYERWVADRLEEL